MWPIVTDDVCVVCLSVGRLLCHTLSPGKTAEAIEMPFGVWSWVGPRNYVLDGF